ncbi:predicted oxidoreductase [Terrimicrobium sacchariphilum]|uniref:Predicted oxidoreductase n=2 Tax=Terrimicrobium sacchariphilum TaxID=690879 RepID=A0A146GCB8_TERSA|nr:aldo/keto reductase [Terrimicrobium sacchariphilum]GAT34176.1 predicted oxidoreductase [Terrimicrobium sacchariphilum]
MFRLDREESLPLTAPMKFRTFGKGGEKVSEIGLGCWQLSGNAWGDLDEAKALEILAAAADAGVNFLDTADVYGTGRSEELIGKFLKSRPGSDFFIATKLGRTSDLYPDKYTEAGVRAALEASLQRLGVETISLVQLHCVPVEVLRQGDIFDWLRKLQAEGKIRHFGASVEDTAQASLCLAQDGLASLQIIFNIFRQTPETTILPAAKAKGIAIIVRLPLASGLLSGKFTKDTLFAENDHRNFNRDGQAFNVGETFAGIPFDKGVELADEMKHFVPESLTMVQMAQRWILDHDEVTVVIPGARTPAQARENASVSRLPELPESLHARLARYYKTEVEPFIRGTY